MTEARCIREHAESFHPGWWLVMPLAKSASGLQIKKLVWELRPAQHSKSTIPRLSFYYLALTMRTIAASPSAPTKVLLRLISKLWFPNVPLNVLAWTSEIQTVCSQSWRWTGLTRFGASTTPSVSASLLYADTGLQTVADKTLTGGRFKERHGGVYARVFHWAPGCSLNANGIFFPENGSVRTRHIPACIQSSNNNAGYVAMTISAGMKGPNVMSNQLKTEFR